MRILKKTRKKLSGDMRLDAETDLAVRSLVAMAVLNKRISIPQIADIYGIRRHTLAATFASLVSMDLIQTTRGNMGGTELKIPPEKITLADIVGTIEPYFKLAPCFDGYPCRLMPGCMYRTSLGEALEAFHEVLSRKTIKDMAEDPGTRAPIIAAAKELGLVSEDFQ